jgi:ABC-type uncharacterized transport system substrate-binding protein
MAGANKTIPHVFGGVTNPYVPGIANSQTDHQSNLTGVGTFQPIETTIRTIREILPAAKKIGIVWNPSEACSEACTKKIREFTKKYHFNLIERMVTSTNEVITALQSLLSEDIDCFITSGDNTVLITVESIANILKQHNIPYFTNNISDVDIGAFASIGADYYDVGVETAKVFERVINGESTSSIPIKNYIPEKIYLNLALANQYGIHLPSNVVSKAYKLKR